MTHLVHEDLSVLVHARVRAQLSAFSAVAGTPNTFSVDVSLIYVGFFSSVGFANCKVFLTSRTYEPTSHFFLDLAMHHFKATLRNRPHILFVGKLSERVFLILSLHFFGV